MQTVIQLSETLVCLYMFIYFINSIWFVVVIFYKQYLVCCSFGLYCWVDVKTTRFAESHRSHGYGSVWPWKAS